MLSTGYLQRQYPTYRFIDKGIILKKFPISKVREGILNGVLVWIGFVGRKRDIRG